MPTWKNGNEDAPPAYIIVPASIVVLWALWGPIKCFMGPHGAHGAQAGGRPAGGRPAAAAAGRRAGGWAEHQDIHRNNNNNIGP